MNRASVLRRLVPAAAILALAGGSFAFLPALLPAEAVRRTVTEEVAARLGAPVSAAGPVSLTLWPKLAVRLENVAVGEPGAPLLDAEAVIGALRVLPLLVGRLSVSDYGLVRPTIIVVRGADGASNWDRVGQALRAATAADQPLPDIRIEDGEAVLRAGPRPATRIAGIDFTLSWPRPDRQATLSGRFLLSGEPVEVSAIVTRPLAMLSAQASAVRLRFSAERLRGGFEGEVSAGPTPLATGTLSAETGSLRGLLRWFGRESGLGAGLGPVALTGEMRALPGSLAFSSVNVELDGNVADGVLTVAAAEGRTRVHGTLDAGRFVATPYLADLNLVGQGGEFWGRRPIDISTLAAVDMDLRLSVGELVVGAAELGRAAAAVTARGGRLAVTLGEAQAYGGILRGALALAPHSSGVELRASLNAQRAQLGGGLGDWFGLRRIDGTANVQIAVEARGRSMADLARSASGSASLTAVDGALRNFNAEAILRRLERRPLAPTGMDARSGRTPFERIAATVRIANGVAATSDAVLDGPAVRIELEGTGQLAPRDVDLRGLATLKRAGGAGFSLPFAVQGSWDDPHFLPDPQSLIRRSGAAAPLRERNRDREALRAVLDAISRSGAGEAAEAAPLSSFAPYPLPVPRE